MTGFIGRNKELKLLNDIYDKPSASLVVVKGRRRIGKSRLVEEFAKNKTFYSFTGLPPTEKTTAQTQREVFAKQIKKAFNIDSKTEDWWDLLWLVADKVKHGKIVVLFDEISWMGYKDPDFLGKLKTIWDSHLKKNSHLVLVLCGSVSSWIEKNILASTGFMGRLSLTLTLEELPLYDCNKFWGKQGELLSSYEKLKLLAVTGGIPRYLEEIHFKLPAEENIRQLCFEKSGILFNEFDQIFSDLFSIRSDIYKHIIIYLADNNADRSQIAKILDLKAGGLLTNYLNDLETAGFITRDFSWQIQSGKTSKLSQYRLSDNYLRFYVKYILPNKRKIESGSFSNKSITSLPGFSTILGLQFENLVIKNMKYIHSLLEIKPEDIISEGPYFQRKTTKQPGCQIDYLIQTKFDCLYVCEIKFSKHEIKRDVIDELQLKITSLKKPRYFSSRPILIHVNGVSEEVEDGGYFSKIIDFSQLLVN